MEPMIVADDFGLCQKHDKVIIDLLNDDKINAVSVLVHSELRKDRVQKICEMRNNISVGLHLNLTVDLPQIQAVDSIRKLLLSDLLGRLDTPIIENSINTQIKHFKNIFGTLPDFIDGHEHVHIIPKILKLLIRITKEESFPKKFWIRSPATATMADLYREFTNGGFKVLIISALGNRARNVLKQLEINTNENFAGFFNLQVATKNFEQRYIQLLTLVKSDMTIMVHPGSIKSPIQIKNHSNEIREIEAKLLKDSNISL